MTRLEENGKVVCEMSERAERKPTGTYEEMVTFQLGAIATMLADISKSLALLAYKAESEETNKLSQIIIEHARRLYPKALNYKGQLTNEQFCEIEKECDIDFYELGRQDTRYTIRYKGERSDKK